MSKCVSVQSGGELPCLPTPPYSNSQFKLPKPNKNNLFHNRSHKGISQVSAILRKAGPGRVDQLVRASSKYAKDAGSVSGQGTYKKQPMNV